MPITERGWPQLDAEIQSNLALATTAALQRAAQLLRHRIREQFSSHGYAWETPWPTRKKERPWPLLIHSARLLDSLTDPTHPEHIERIEHNTLTFGTTVPYAAPLHFGTQSLPPRPLITPTMLPDLTNPTQEQTPAQQLGLETVLSF